MLMLCSLKGEKKICPLTSYSVLCPWVCGRKLLEVELLDALTAIIVERKKENKRKGKEKRNSTLNFFSFERWGLPHSGSSLLGWGQRGEITGGAWSLKLLRHSGLSYTFCLCVIGNQWNQAGCPTCLKYREALSFSLGRMILLAWKALRFGQKPSVETSGKKNQLEARMI